jgi:hypothetical protein
MLNITYTSEEFNASFLAVENNSTLGGPIKQAVAVMSH